MGLTSGRVWHSGTVGPVTPGPGPGPAPVLRPGVWSGMASENMVCCMGKLVYLTQGDMKGCGDISGWGWNMGGNTWILSMAMGIWVVAVWPGGHPATGGGGGDTKLELLELDMMMELSDWQDRVGELGEGGGTLNCWGLYGIVGPLGDDWNKT